MNRRSFLGSLLSIAAVVGISNGVAAEPAKPVKDALSIKIFAGDVLIGIARDMQVDEWRDVDHIKDNDGGVIESIPGNINIEASSSLIRFDKNTLYGAFDKGIVTAATQIIPLRIEVSNINGTTILENAWIASPCKFYTFIGEDYTIAADGPVIFNVERIR